MRRNLRLLPFNQALTSSYVWIPVLVLVTRARFDLDGAVLLAAVYYLSVVLFEVPSGWMSDRLGRVTTLRLAALAWVVAHSCLLFAGESFVLFAVGQFMLAAGFASLSGTDVAFHFDTLEALGRAEEFADRQARLSAIGYTATAASAVMGGGLGLIDLRLAFAASLALALVQLALSWWLLEPSASPLHGDTGASGDGRGSFRVVEDVLGCLRYLRNPLLGWIFCYGIAMVTLEHVAVTVLQPWLTEALGESAGDVGATPGYSGLVYASFALVGAGAARLSAPLAARIGTVPTLLGLAALSALVVSGMALSFSVLIIGLIIFRSVQGAAAPVLISAAVAPRVARHHRATLLSLNSLAGRLCYGLILFAVSARVADDVPLVLGIFTAISWSLVVVLLVTSTIANSSSDTASSTGQGTDRSTMMTTKRRPPGGEKTAGPGPAARDR